jgi:HAD superfamily 5'-nucleotidase-like hydrolase
VKRALNPNDRKKRLKPLNDIFSMAECCLIADTIQFFKDREILFSPRNVVNDVLKAVTDTHISGEFHTQVANNPEKYFNPTPHLKQVLGNLKASGKRLIFVSNSPFWYVDAGMRYIFGKGWRSQWDAIITSAGKPNFYVSNETINNQMERYSFSCVKHPILTDGFHFPVRLLVVFHTDRLEPTLP